MACPLKMYVVSFEVTIMIKQRKNHFTSQIMWKNRVFPHLQYTEVDEQANSSEYYGFAYLQYWQDQFSGKWSAVVSSLMQQLFHHQWKIA